MYYEDAEDRCVYRKGNSSFFMEGEIEDRMLKECSNALKKVIIEPAISTQIVKFYLQASILADRDSKPPCIRLHHYT